MSLPKPLRSLCNLLFFEDEENICKVVLQRPVDEVQDILAQQDFDALTSEEALKQIIRIAIANETANPQRQML